jgi:hypothetical protein
MACKKKAKAEVKAKGTAKKNPARDVQKRPKR